MIDNDVPNPPMRSERQFLLYYLIHVKKKSIEIYGIDDMAAAMMNGY